MGATRTEPVGLGCNSAGRVYDPCGLLGRTLTNRTIGMAFVQTRKKVVEAGRLQDGSIVRSNKDCRGVGSPDVSARLEVAYGGIPD